MADTEASITIRTGPAIKVGIGVVIALVGAMIYQTWSVGQYVQRQEGRLDTIEKSHAQLEVRVGVVEKLQVAENSRLLILEEHDRSQTGAIQESRVAASENSKAAGAAFAMLQSQLSALEASMGRQMADINAKMSFLVDKSRGRTESFPPETTPPPFDRAFVR